MKGVTSDYSQVSIAYYFTKTKHQSKYGKHAIEEEEEIESGSPTASDFQAPIIYSQLIVLNRPFDIDMVALFNEYRFAKEKKKKKKKDLIMLLSKIKKKPLLKENGKKKNGWIAKTHIVLWFCWKLLHSNKYFKK